MCVTVVVTITILLTLTKIVTLTVIVAVTVTVIVIVIANRLVGGSCEGHSLLQLIFVVIVVHHQSVNQTVQIIRVGTQSGVGCEDPAHGKFAFWIDGWVEVVLVVNDVLLDVVVELTGRVEALSTKR